MEEKNYPTLKLESALEEIIVKVEKHFQKDEPKGFFQGLFKKKTKASEDPDPEEKRKNIVKLFFEKFKPELVIDYKNAFDKEQLKSEIIENFKSQKDNLLYIQLDDYQDLPIIILGKYSKMTDKNYTYTIEGGYTQDVTVKAIEFKKPDRDRPEGIEHLKELDILPKIANMINNIKKPKIYSIKINSIEGEATGNEETTGGKRKKTRNNKKKSSKKSKKSKKKNTKKNKTKKKGKK